MYVCQERGSNISTRAGQTHLQLPNRPELHLEVRFCDNYRSLMQTLVSQQSQGYLRWLIIEPQLHRSSSDPGENPVSELTVRVSSHTVLIEAGRPTQTVADTIPCAVIPD